MHLADSVGFAFGHAAQGRNVAEGHYEAAQTMVAPAAGAIGVEKIMPNRQFPENAADGHYVAEGHYVYAAQGRNVAVMLSLPTSGQIEQKL